MPLVLLLLLLAFGSSANAAEKPRLRVLTSILPIYCLAANVAGDDATVENLLPGKVDPHEYQFTPKDLARLRQADLILINGLGLEGWLRRAMENGAAPGMKVVEVTEGLEKQLIASTGDVHDHDHDHKHAAGANPHTWLDPRLAQLCVSNILGALIAADASRADAFRANAARYQLKLAELDREMEAALQPVRQQAFVTQHEAFPYLIRRYGLTLAGVVEEVPEVAPGSRHLRDLYQKVRDQKVRAIFYQPASATKLVRQMAQDLGVKCLELDPLETGEIRPSAYEEGMRRNTRALLEGLK